MVANNLRKLPSSSSTKMGSAQTKDEDSIGSFCSEDDSSMQSSKEIGRLADLDRLESFRTFRDFTNIFRAFAYLPSTRSLEPALLSRIALAVVAMVCTVRCFVG